MPHLALSPRLIASGQAFATELMANPDLRPLHPRHEVKVTRWKDPGIGPGIYPVRSDLRLEFQRSTLNTGRITGDLLDANRLVSVVWSWVEIGQGVRLQQVSPCPNPPSPRAGDGGASTDGGDRSLCGAQKGRAEAGFDVDFDRGADSPSHRLPRTQKREIHWNVVTPDCHPRRLIFGAKRSTQDQAIYIPKSPSISSLYQRRQRRAIRGKWGKTDLNCLRTRRSTN